MPYDTAKPSRTPHGVRELKRYFLCHEYGDESRRTPHGVRELKHSTAERQRIYKRRTPHGVRELKLLKKQVLRTGQMSHPARGA